jgi:hypothetical protein
MERRIRQWRALHGKDRDEAVGHSVMYDELYRKRKTRGIV